jgi:hypothetical protein
MICEETGLPFHDLDWQVKLNNKEDPARRIGTFVDSDEEKEGLGNSLQFLSAADFSRFIAFCLGFSCWFHR